jgi:hypothetical protein
VVAVVPLGRYPLPSGIDWSLVGPAACATAFLRGDGLAGKPNDPPGLHRVGHYPSWSTSSHKAAMASASDTPAHRQRRAAARTAAPRVG